MPEFLSSIVENDWLRAAGGITVLVVLAWGANVAAGPNAGAGA